MKSNKEVTSNSFLIGEYEKYLDYYLDALANWHEKINRDPKEFSFNELSEPLASFEHFKTWYPTGQLPAISALKKHDLHPHS